MHLVGVGAAQPLILFGAKFDKGWKVPKPSTYRQRNSGPNCKTLVGFQTFALWGRNIMPGVSRVGCRSTLVDLEARTSKYKLSNFGFDK
jgi:hypothetical protein